MPGTTARDEERIQNPTTMSDWTPRRRLPFVRYLLIGSALVFVALGVLAFVVQVEDYVTATGRVHPANEVEVRSSVEAVVAEVLVEPGQQVQADQVLAVLDDSALQDEFQQLVLQQKRQEARLEVARRRLAALRLNPLPAEFRHSDILLEEARLELKLAEAKLAHATGPVEKEDRQAQRDRARHKVSRAERLDALVKAGLAEAIIAEAEAECAELGQHANALKKRQEQVRARMKRYELRAPQAGVAAAILKDRGEAVRPGELVVTMAVGPGRCIHLRIGEEEFGEVAAGEPARFYSKMYPYRKYGYATGSVSTIHPWARQEGGVIFYEGIADVTDAPFTLELGSSVSVEIDLGPKPLYRWLTD